MSCGGFAFTPKPLVLDVIIQDPKAEGGQPFRYPDWDIDDIIYRPTLEGGMYESIFDPIKEYLPRYICEFDSRMFVYPSTKGIPEPEVARASIRSLYRFAAFIRKNVKEMGEFWYAMQWAEIVPEKPEDMIIIEMNVDDLKFEGPGMDSFQFKKNVFYRFTGE